jgi:hypothetical protein
MLAKMDAKIDPSQEKINANQERQEAKMDCHHEKLMIIVEAS